MSKKEIGNGQKFASAKMQKESSDFHEFFRDSVSELYWAENHLVKALPKIVQRVPYH